MNATGWTLISLILEGCWELFYATYNIEMNRGYGVKNL